jgi:tetratricopeptide (TPR) repeat protein
MARTVRAVVESLSTGQAHRRWLLVFDNADRPDDLTQYLPYPIPTGHVLITSRNLGWSDVASTVQVDVFDRPESIALLRDRSQDISDEDANRLADRLGDLPLALEQAAAWRAETGMPVNEYLQLFDDQLEQLTELKPSNYPAPVGATYRLAFDRLREQSPAAAQLLELAAFFGAEPIPVSLLWDGRNADLPSPLDQTMREPIRMRRALRDIGRFALAKIDPVQDQISVHRLVQAVLRSRLSAEEQADTRRVAQRILALASPSNPDDERNWPRHAELSPHILPTGVIGSDDVEVRRVALDQVRYRYVRDDYEGSKALGELVVAEWQPRWGNDDELTLLACRHLANALRRLGDYGRAASLAGETLAHMRRVFGDDNEHTLATVDTVGWDLRIAGRFREAKELDEDNYRRHGEVFGLDDPVTLRIQNNFALDLQWVGEFSRAREVDADSVRRRREVYGNEHRRTQLAVGSLARDNYRLGRYDEALTLQETALGIQRRLYGPEHSDVLSGTRNLVAILRKLGEHSRARDLAENLLPTYQRRFGPIHEQTLAAMTSAANALRTEDRERAREFCQEALDCYNVNFGDDHPFTLVCASNLAIVLRHLDRNEEALALNQPTLAALRRVLGPDHPFTLCCATNTASDLSALHRHEEALALSEETLLKSRAVRGDTHPYTFACALNLALDQQALGLDGTALRTEAISGFQAHLGKEHLETLAALRGSRADCDIEAPET